MQFEMTKVTRFEVIDWTNDSAPVASRLLALYNVSVELSLQDDGKTLKVFLREIEES